VLLIGTVVLCFSTGAFAQREVKQLQQAQKAAQQVQPVPYGDVLTSTMQNKPLDEKATLAAEHVELQRIEGASAHNQVKIQIFVNMLCLMFLFGAFCMIWAQNTARNPLLWFAAGFCFTFVTIVVILRKNAKTHRRKRYHRNGGGYVDFAQFY